MPPLRIFENLRKQVHLLDPRTMAEIRALRGNNLAEELTSCLRLPPAALAIAGRLLAARFAASKQELARHWQPRPEQPATKGKQSNATSATSGPTATHLRSLNAESDAQRTNRALGFAIDVILPRWSVFQAQMSLGGADLPLGTENAPITRQPAAHIAADVDVLCEVLPFEESMVDLSRCLSGILHTCREDTARNIYEQILVKARTQKKQPHIIDKAIEISLATYPTFNANVMRWLLCTLLANYKHCGAHTRPDFDTRWVIHSLFGEYVCLRPPSAAKVAELTRDRGVAMQTIVELWCKSNNQDRVKLRTKLYGKCRRIIEVAVHEYIVSLIDSVQALKSHAVKHLAYARYRATVLSAADKLRAYVHLQCRGDGTMTPRRLLGGDETFAAELTLLLKQEFEKLTNLSEKRPHEPFASAVVRGFESARSPSDYLPADLLSFLTTSRGEDAEASVYRILRGGDEKESKRPADLADLIARVRVQRGNANVMHAPHERSLYDALPFGLPVAHCAALYEILRRFSHFVDADATLGAALQFIELFGVPSKAANFVRKTLESHSLRAISSKVRTTKLAQLRKAYPMTYHVLGAMCMLLVHARRYRKFALPRSMKVQQAQALSRRVAGLYVNGGGPGERETLAVSPVDTEVWICMVCDRVYHHEVTHRSTFKSGDHHGAASSGPCVDISKQPCDMRCSEDAGGIYGHMKCSKATLTRIDLLGFGLECPRTRSKVDKQIFHIPSAIRMNCPECGERYVSVPHLALWTANGENCWNCTKREMRRRRDLEIQQHSIHFFLSDALKCLLCGRAFKQTGKNIAKLRSGIHIYGTKIAICQRHPHRRILDALQEAEGNLLPENATTDIFRPDVQEPISAFLVKWQCSFKDEKVKNQAIKDAKSNNRVSQIKAMQRHYNYG